MSEKFEQLYEKYEQINQKLKNPSIKLEDAIDLYKESKIYYQKMKKILENSKLEIISEEFSDE